MIWLVTLTSWSEIEDLCFHSTEELAKQCRLFNRGYDPHSEVRMERFQVDRENGAE